MAQIALKEPSISNSMLIAGRRSFKLKLAVSNVAISLTYPPPDHLRILSITSSLNYSFTAVARTTGYLSQQGDGLLLLYCGPINPALEIQCQHHQKKQRSYPGEQTKRKLRRSLPIFEHVPAAEYTCLDPHYKCAFTFLQPFFFLYRSLPIIP